MDLLIRAFDAGRLAETATVFGSLLLTLVVLFVPIAFLIALAQRWLGRERLRRWLGGDRASVAVGKGLALGALTPFCGCSSIPLLAGLLQARVRFAAVTAFFIASPLLSPFVLVVVAVLFAPRAALAYAVFAGAVTVATALAWEWLGLERWLRPHVRAAPIAGGSGGTRPATAAACGANTSESTGGCAATPGDEPAAVLTPSASTADTSTWRGWRVESRRAAGEAWTLLRPMRVPMVVGVGVGALIYGAVPDAVVIGAVEAAGPAAVPLAAALGIPLYLRGSAAFPIGAALLAAGVPTGPMLAMVIGGMAASLPEVLMLRGLFTARLLAAFLATVLAVAVMAGTLLPPLWAAA